jgi:rod shape determining protein RodA
MKSLFLAVAFILVAGLIVISGVSRELFFQQLLWAGMGAAIVLVFLRLDWRSLFNYRWLIWGIYAATLFLLALAYLTSPVIRNTRSWIVIGNFSFQPVEIAKVALILIYAQFFSKRHLAIAHWRNILISFVLFVLPAGLTLLLPDMGSAFVLFGIWFGFLLVSGLPGRRVIAALIVFAIAGFIGWHTILQNYQKERILGIFYPERNALTVNYSMIQSQIAIGSAGLWGKGYGQGTQTQLGFLTEPANDFIFAALVEEWGLVFGLLVIAAFVFLVMRILRVGALASTNLEKFLCLGVALTFVLRFLINAGSNVGIFPVIGITFPFLSYGGSSLLTDFFLLAIISSIARRT